MFYFVSVLDFLSRTICRVLNCCGALRRPAKIETLRICSGGLRTAGAGTESGRRRSAIGAALFRSPTSSSNSEANTEEGRLMLAACSSNKIGIISVQISTLTLHNSIRKVGKPQKKY
uniref:Uncharacterized protein n=1 Tax=Sander lucioperca TaxID=283035 RepID=A0A8C9YYX9_SANLU